MKFPLIRELATAYVVSDAINSMYKYNHRNVVVKNKDQFFILTAGDLLQLKLKEYNFSTKLSDIYLEKLPIIDKDENILDAISFLESSLEYIGVVNDDESFYGILTHTDIISNIDPETLIENYRMGDLINMNKYIQKVEKDVLASSVLEKMADSQGDCVVIVKNDKPIGIITIKDIMQLMKNHSDLTVTASFGITEVKVGDEIGIAIKRADDALYEAKNSGRNCIKINI